MHWCEIVDLVSTAGTGSDKHHVRSMAFSNFLYERRRNLERKVVFFRKHTERPRHAPTTGVEQNRLSTRKPLSEANHEARMQKRLRVAMRVDRHLRRMVCELQCLRFTL